MADAFVRVLVFPSFSLHQFLSTFLEKHNEQRDGRLRLIADSQGKALFSEA